MNFLDAAYQVLKNAGTPLHYSEITKRALADQILDTKGLTPEATMGSRLYVDTKRPNSRFKRVGRNFFTIAAVQSTSIGQNVNALNEHTRNELRQQLLQMPPDRFEALIGELLLAIGFDEESLQVTTYGGDGGIDVRGVLNAGNITAVNAAVQVKRWKRNIQAPVVQSIRGSLVVHEQGIIVTTSSFSKGAIAEAQAPGKARISLVDGEQLLDLLMKHRIGVKAEAYTVYSPDQEWWSGIASAPESSTAEIIVVNAEPEYTKITEDTKPFLLRQDISYPLQIQAVVHGQTVEAELINAMGNVQFNGVEYKSPSGAGKTAAGWKSCNGWVFWRYQEPSTSEWRLIQELRV